MSAADDSLSSSVDVISASPSPARAAPDVTRPLAWRAPPRPPRAASPLLISDDSDDGAAAGRAILISSDEDDEEDGAAVPRTPGRRRARARIASDEEEEEEDSSPEPDDIVQQSFEERAAPDWRHRWGAPRGPGRHASAGDASALSAASAGKDASSFFDASASGVSDGGEAAAGGRTADGGSGDVKGNASGRSAEEKGGREDGNGDGVDDKNARKGDAVGAEDPRRRAERLYGNYTIKKRSSPPSESRPTSRGSADSAGGMAETNSTAGRLATNGHLRQSHGHPTETAASRQPAEGRGRPCPPVSESGREPVPGPAATVSGAAPGRPAAGASDGPDCKAGAPDCKAGAPDSRAGAPAGDLDSPDLSHLSVSELEQQLKQKEMVARVSNLAALPDGGRRLQAHIHQLRQTLARRRAAPGAPGAPGAHSAPGGGQAPGGRPPDRLQQVMAQIQQKKRQFSTSSHRSEPAVAAQLQKDIFRLETEMMKLQMQTGIVTGSGRNPFGGGRAAPLSRPRQPGQQQAAAAGGPHQAGGGMTLEAALRSGTPITTAGTAQQRRLEAEARESLLDFGQVRPQLTAALLAANPELGRLYGGRMTEARHEQASNVTTEELQRLHRSLATCPASGAADPGPACLNLALMPHQQYALAWLQWREAQQPSGGILADDMGLGKTLTMIAHCLRVQELERGAAAQEQEAGERAKPEPHREEGLWASKDKPVKAEKPAAAAEATLVICPASVLLQWEAEVKRRTQRGSVSVLLYHGPGRRAEHSPRRLRKADFVLTTYDIVRTEVEKGNLMGAKKADLSPLLEVTWRRVVLDEAHQIRNRNTKAAKSVCELEATSRWMLSGTPIQNGREDLYSLMRFLRAVPFSEYEVWKRWIDKSPRGDERLSLIVKAMVLRRTKEETSAVTGKPLVALPEKEKRRHLVKLHEHERAVYDKVFAFCKSSLQEFIKLQEQREYEKELKTNPRAQPPPGLNITPQKDSPAGAAGPSGLGEKGSIKQHHLLVQLLRLRQICCHPALAKTVISTGERESAGYGEEDVAAELEAQLLGLSLNETTAQPDRQAAVLAADNPVFSRDWRSSKLRCLLEEVRKIVADSREKIVVVSQWTSMLEIVRDHLRQERVQSCTISGTVKMAERQQIIETFNGSAGGPRVMLLSLLAGGVGLNLVGGNHLFILDPHWNPQLEEQAGDRIYRVGQSRDVFIHRFVCENTLEERIVELQENKLSIARSVLAGEKLASNKLSMNDLKMLFNIR